MNLYDSGKMADALKAAGHSECFDIEASPNLLIFNTCSIREKADEKLFSDLGRAKPLKIGATEQGKPFVIIVCGCVAQVKSAEIMKRAPYVDAILGTRETQKIVEVLDEILRRVKASNAATDNICENLDFKSAVIGNVCVKSQPLSKTYSSQEFYYPLVFCSMDTSEKFSHFRNIAPISGTKSVSEFLTIQEGCDNFCTYCVVPFTRGREFSRNVSDIIEEAKKLTSMGTKEIVLLGQNVNSYRGRGDDDTTWSLARLLYAIASEVPGLVRLRYLTSHPKDIAEDIAKAHRDIDILAPFLHLPIQSGSDKILGKMNRKYSVAEYLERVEVLKEYRPDMAFSSDFIVGFPGETDADFAKTLEVAEKMHYAQAYSFKYSPRKETAAARMENQIPENLKEERLKILQDVLNAHQNQFNKETIGKTVNVLFTKAGKFDGQLVGRSEYLQAVSIDSNNQVKSGDMVKVRIAKLKSHSLFGEMVDR